MPASTITSQELNRKAALALKAAARGPVFITDLELPTFVLFNIQDYYLITNGGHVDDAELVNQPNRLDAKTTSVKP
jgi:hypothetical protein